MFRFLGPFSLRQDAVHRSWAVRAGLFVIRGLDYVAPTISPFEHRTVQVQSLRVAGADWMALGATFGRALLESAVGFVLAVSVLRRRHSSSQLIRVNSSDSVGALR